MSLSPDRHFDPDYVWPGFGSPPNYYPDLLNSESDYEYDIPKVESLGNWGFATPQYQEDGTYNPAGRQGVVGWIDGAVEGIEDEKVREESRELARGWIPIAEKYGWRLPSTEQASQVFLNAVENVDTALWLLVGGYQKDSTGDYEIHPHSADCGETGPLCLFTPNGELRDRRTDQIISGGIYGPLAGTATGASIAGVDYTGRDFGYGFAYPVYRENLALAATANLRPVRAISGVYGLTVRGAYSGRLWGRGAQTVDLTGAGNAIGSAVSWQRGGLTLRSGIAVQREGVGSLTGARAFRAPSTVSAAITTAYGKALPYGCSAHLQADHWRALSTRGRSLWENASLNESRVTAAFVKRAGKHEFALQGLWRSGLAGSLAVSGRAWAVAPQAESGVWLTWLQRSQ